MADLFTLAYTIRAKVADYYTANSYPLPVMQQVVPGVPAADCEMFAVQVSATGPHQGNPLQDVADVTAFGWMRYARIVLWVLRCVPTVDDSGNPPSVDDTETAAQAILLDADRLWSGVQATVDGGYLPGCKSVAHTGWQNLEPRGGIGGGALTIIVDLTDW